MAIDLFRTQVTALPEHAFLKCSSLTAVLLPKTLKVIGVSAFLG